LSEYIESFRIINDYAFFKLKELQVLRHLLLSFALSVLSGCTITTAQTQKLSEAQARNIVYDLLGGIIKNVQTSVQDKTVLYIVALRQPYQNAHESETVWQS
jgi:hypothetical protein